MVNISPESMERVILKGRPVRRNTFPAAGIFKL
jgi:hypothetical protein